MKVLLCSPLNSGGGISRWTSHILNYYESLGTKEIELVHLYDKVPGVDVKINVAQRILRGIKTYSLMYRDIKKELRKNKYEIFHMCSSASMSLLKDILILKEVKRQNVKSVIHFRFGRIPELFQTKNWEYKLLCAVCNLADKVIVIDEASYNVLISHGFKNIELLPNVLSQQVIDVVSSNTDIKRIDRKLVFVGYGLKEKGVFELVKATKDIPNISLSMIGFISDDIKYQLYKEAGNDSESWLHIYGRKDYEVVIKEMLSANVFILPTYTEGFPNAILESMACGCPIVTTDVGAIPEMLDIKNGFNHGICVKPRDVDGLKNAILKMLNDKEYAISCGKHAKERVERLYTINIVWEKLVKLWTSI